MMIPEKAQQPLHIKIKNNNLYEIQEIETSSTTMYGKSIKKHSYVSKYTDKTAQSMQSWGYSRSAFLGLIKLSIFMTLMLLNIKQIYKKKSCLYEWFYLCMLTYTKLIQYKVCRNITNYYSLVQPDQFIIIKWTFMLLSNIRQNSGINTVLWKK